MRILQERKKPGTVTVSPAGVGLLKKKFAHGGNGNVSGKKFGKNTPKRKNQASWKGEG